MNDPRGIPVVARLDEIGYGVDMVDICRASHAVDGLVEQPLALDACPEIVLSEGAAA